MLEGQQLGDQTQYYPVFILKFFSMYLMVVALLDLLLQLGMYIF